MTTVFYDHLIPWHLVDQYLLQEQLHGEERVEFLQLVDEVVHTEVFLLFLHQLPEDHHAVFIERFHANPADEQHLVFLVEVVGEQLPQLIAQRAEVVLVEVLGGDEELSNQK